MRIAGSTRGARWLPAALLLACPGAGSAQDEIHCREAHRFLAEERGAVALTEPDTIDDWRTQQRVAGCRVTAAGITRRSPGEEARDFFERLREAGWARTPDPRDAPNEASLRFRRDGSDCLFSFYTGGILGTDAEASVEDAVAPGPGERRYGFLVLCMAEREAAPRQPRGEPSSSPSSGSSRAPFSSHTAKVDSPSP